MVRDTEKQKQSKRNWYLKHKEITKERSKRSKYKRREVTTEFFNRLKDKYPCSVCKETNYACLEFHHLDSSTKEGNISHLKRKDYFGNILFDEITKCCILCKNCHAKLHDNQFNIETTSSLQNIDREYLNQLKLEIKTWKKNQQGADLVLKTSGT